MDAPHIEITFRPDTPVETGRFNRRGPIVRVVPGYHARFAALVAVPEYETVEPRKEGFGHKELKAEVMARQVQALRSLRACAEEAGLDRPSLRTLSLRISNQPGPGLLRLCLIGKAFASSPDLASQRASALWADVRAFFSSDYQPSPATRQAEYLDWTAHSWLNTMRHPDQLIEARQRETRLPDLASLSPEASACVLHPFRPNLHALESVWCGLAQQEGRAMLSVTLRAATLHRSEIYGLADLGERVSRLTQDTSPEARALATVAATHYSGLPASLREPFIMHVSVMADQSARSVAHAVGTSLTPQEATADRLPAAYALFTPSSAELPIARQNLDLLEVDGWGTCLLPGTCRRLRWLVSPETAQAAFRLPLPPRGGWPGVSFVPMIAPKT